MRGKQLFCAGTTPAIRYAREELRSMGFDIAEDVCWNVGHLILDIPSFRNNDTLRTGSRTDTLLGSLPKDILIWGGNLDHPVLEDYQTVDLLKDEHYLAQNAAITADCAVKIAAPMLKTTWQDAPALVIGWGRIGKCLGRLLKSIGSDVTVASGNPVSRAALQSLGYRTADTRYISEDASGYRIVFNTAPSPVITDETAHLWQHCIKIDLASRKGIEGEDVIWARGLPGIHAPESSGKLIAQTIAGLWKEKNA